MKNSITVGEHVIFFFPVGEANEINNCSQIAPAIVNRVWSDTTVNLTVFRDCHSPASKTSVLRATSVKDALTGNKWATAIECAAWGIDLSDGYQKLESLVPNANEEVQPSESGEIAPAQN